jgi:CBS domain containing-hemolysin-like protein
LEYHPYERRFVLLLQLCLAVGIAVTVSALCSVLEAVLYSVPGSHLEVLQKKGVKAGFILQEMRGNISGPIAAILTLNTVANTMGAAVAGASAAVLFGEAGLAWFSVAFTVIILIFSEILPKTIGVAYSRELAPWIALPLKIMVKILTPAILFCHMLTRLIPRTSETALASADEVRAIAALGLRSGSIDSQEEKVIVNILELKKKSVIDAMTPRPVTFILDGSLTVDEANQHQEAWERHSRVPVYRKNPNEITGIVLRKDLLLAAMAGRNAASLESLANPVHFVPESAPLSRVLVDFFEKHQHLFVVVDEYGSFTGVISLEDVIEEIMGREIMDESDQIRDMRALAKSRRKERVKKDSHRP